MDIAKYVGIFLLKNEYCFLPGIGSLQIEKHPSVYDKESQKMTAPVYEVRYRQVGGSIDDSFANFIANNERISIAHAANHLKDFCARAKADLREGRDIEIPGIGKFSGGPNDTIHFVTDPQLHIEGKQIPFFKNSAGLSQRKEEAISNIIERTNIREPKADEEIEYKAPSVNWGKIVALIVIILVIIGGIIFAFQYMNKGTGEPQQPQPEAVQQPDNTTVAPVEDTATNNAATQPEQPVETANADGSVSYKIALNQYPSKEKAESRVAKLQSYGNSGVSLYTKDSTYYVVMSVTSAASDSTRMVDSLKRLFNPSGNVHIVR